ncbi:MAG: hypothetical protein IKK45_04055 [Akkermansia sp.]|nr:hypothetical protein [Akkermansia sp.]
MRQALLAACVGLLLASCSFVRETEQELMTAPTPEEEAQLGNPLAPGSMHHENAVNYNVTTSEELERIDNGAEGEVYFTDPDNPDKEIAGITAAFEARNNGNGWLTDYGLAIRFAHRECRPIIIWFHDSVISPKSARLGEQLLDTPKFNEWCKNRVVRIKLDSGASIDDRSGKNAKYSHTAINRLAKRYGITRKPGLAVVSPRGQLIVGIDGYDGFIQSIESILKGGVVRCEKEMLAYREKLQKRGYRTWHSAQGGMSLFARLQRFDSEHNMVYLKEYGGRISRTKLHRFSREDKEYIAAREARKLERKRRRREF